MTTDPPRKRSLPVGAAEDVAIVDQGIKRWVVGPLQVQRHADLRQGRLPKLGVHILAGVIGKG